MSQPSNRDTPRSLDQTGNVSEPVSYEEGYLNGRSSERRLQEDSYIARENNNAASGLVLGLAIAALVGIAGGAFIYMNQRQDSPRQQILPIPVPNSSQPQSQPKTTQKDTTIIERTVNKTKEVIPVPQQPAPAPQQKAPEININVPSPAQETSAPDTQAAPEQSKTKGTDQNQGADQKSASPD